MIRSQTWQSFSLTRSLYSLQLITTTFTYAWLISIPIALTVATTTQVSNFSTRFIWPLTNMNNVKKLNSCTVGERQRKN